MRTLLQDLKYGVRVLLKSRGFALVAVITLALGIGASTAAFSVVHAVLLRPLPFPEQERLFVAWKRDAATNNPFVELSVADFRDWQAQSQSFESLAVVPTPVAGWAWWRRGRGEPVQLESAKVTGRYFNVLGARAALGRVFDESDDRVGGPLVVVLSASLSRERFRARPQRV